MATIELAGPVGYTLTATLGPIGTDTVAVAGVPLTERTNARGKYVGSVTGLSGWYWAQLYAAGVLVGAWDILLADDDALYLGQDRDHAVWARLQAQVTQGPVIFVPTPPPVGKTTAWGRVFDADGDPVPDVTVNVQATADTTGGSYSRTVFAAVTNAEGIWNTWVHRRASLRFHCWIGNGVKERFSGVDADAVQAPELFV